DKDPKNIMKVYTGFTPNFALNLSNAILSISLFELARDAFASKRGVSSSEIGGYEYFICSLIGGMMSSAVLNFLEVFTIHKIVNPSITFKNFLTSKEFFSSLKSGVV